MGLIQDKFAEWKNKKANDKFEREISIEIKD